MKRTRLLMLMLCAVLCCAPPAYSQGILGKIAKKAEQINKGLKKVNEGLDKVLNPNSSKQSDSNTGRSNQSNSQNAATSESKQAAKPMRPLTEAEMQQLIGVAPYIDSRTKFIVLPEDVWDKYGHASDVVEGVFTLQCRNGLLIYYDIDTAEKIVAVKGWGISKDCFAPYENDAPNRANFSGGFQIIERSKPPVEGVSKYVSVCSDGNVYTLPKTYGSMTEMQDGMAFAAPYASSTKGTTTVNPYGGNLYPSIDSRLTDNVNRKLKEDRRAIMIDEYDKWGFIDSKGNVVIPGKYDAVTDFSGGQAWVAIDGKMGLIDKSGKEILPPSIAIKNTKVLGPNYISELSPEGIYRFVLDEWTTVYLDKNGKEIKRYEHAQGTPFVNGLAWVDYHAAYNNGRIDIIDKDFNVVKTLDNSKGSYYTSHILPKFVPGLNIAINGDNEYVDQMGNFMIVDTHHLVNTGRTFTADGYAWLRFTEPFTFSSYMRPDGSLAVVIVNSREEAQKIIDFPPFNPPPYLNDPIPDPPLPEDPIEETKIQEPPKGKQTFQVEVKVVPPEAATVKGSGRYEFNSDVAVSGTFADGWLLGAVETSSRIKPTDREFVYRVEGSGTVTIYCVKEEDLDAAPDMALEGTLVVEDISIPLYLETSAKGDYASEYGPATTGVFAPIIDPNEPLVFNDKLSASARAFCPPMKVEGISQIDGKKYLVVTGITIMTGQLSTAGNGDLQSLGASMWFNMLIMLNGFDNIVTMPRTYRVEMKDIDGQSGEFTFGKIETWSPRYGWVPGGDPRVYHRKNGMLSTCVDKGWDVNDYDGIKMKTTKKRDNLIWAPPADFFSRPPTDFSNKVYNTPSEFQTAMKEKGARTFGPK